MSSARRRTTPGSSRASWRANGTPHLPVPMVTHWPWSDLGSAILETYAHDRTRGAAVTSNEESVESKPARRGAQGRKSSADIAARRHQGRMLALQVLYEVDLT